MPYISQGRRTHFKTYDRSYVPSDQGGLCYIFYLLAKRYIKINGRSYATLSAVIAALTDAAAEIRRKEMVPYEDRKCRVNGEVEV